MELWKSKYRPSVANMTVKINILIVNTVAMVITVLAVVVDTFVELLSCNPLVLAAKMRLLSHVQLFVTPWTTAHQAPPSMGLSRQEHWSGLPFHSPASKDEAIRV